MSKGKLNVEFGAVEGAAADLLNGANRLEGRLTELERQLDKLKGDAWMGQGNEQYQASKRQWDAAMADMKQLLAQIGMAARNSGSDFQDTERRISNSFG